MRSIAPILFILVLTSAACAQTSGVASSSDARLADARRALDAGVALAAPDSLLAARAQFTLLADGDAWATYYAALADYRLANAFWASDSERAKTHAASGASALRTLRRRRDLPGSLPTEAAALHSALLSARIGLDGSLAMTLGADAASATADAVGLGPENPRVLFVQATSLLNTPPEWGGDPDAALDALSRSIAGFEAAGAPVGDAPRWGHDEALAWLGMAHLMRGDAGAARAPIEAAEAMNPRSEFIRFKLRPWLDGMAATDPSPEND